MENLVLYLTLIITFLIREFNAETLEILSSTPPTDPFKNDNSNVEKKEVDVPENSLQNSLATQNTQHPVQGYMPQPVYPIYTGGYFYPGINPNSVMETNQQVQNSGTYLSSVLPVAQMGFEIIRNLFLYFLIRYFVLKLIKVFNLILELRDVLITDETSVLLTKAALQAGLKLFAKVGLFAIAGAALLVIGGIFTTIVCSLTPICTITFNGYDFKALNKDTVRSLMTPEKIASAAALVQDAIGKYQRLQRAVGQH
ncbi:uncharacterized protein LOC115879335 isoform X1 [Sitophilus oryzae]|uniref:Uncharacterized protein LOC115879335 isoform X1 n=1 Tax=Sitophilus oryzae TaxID=7048 RepID=A0A6J2XKD4_SITOR|nr:uncharacterized protein LOC115879335 isoform X1 [Sitophilus oryzae]